MLENNATVRGFTIRGGRTRKYVSGAATSNIDFVGGGVCGANNSDYATRLVEDCTITNCVSAWGGGAVSVSLVRCNVSICGATRYGAATYMCSHESCYVGNYAAGTGAYNVFYPRGLLNSTITSDDFGNQCYANEDRPPTNSLFLAKVAITQWSTNAVGCIFKRYTANVVRPEVMPEGSTCDFVDNLEALNFDEHGRPTKDSLTVDFCANRQYLSSSLDLAGHPRVLNKKVDCGCYEYDWRVDYAADIGAKNLSVDSASPDVEENESSGKVRLSDGCEIVMSWTPATAAQRMFPVAISGTGELAAYVNGSLVATLTSANTSFEWEGAAGTDEIRLAFSGDGYAELGKPKNLSGSMVIIR